MVDPKNRRALRRGLPWTHFGFVVLVASLVVWLSDPLLERVVSPGLVDLGAEALGLFGALLFAGGLSAFVGARRDGPGGRWLDLSLVLWLAEVGLRLARIAIPGVLGQQALGLRFLIVAGAIAAFASWMQAVWRDDATRRVRASWSTTRTLFLLQLAGAVMLATLPGTGEWLLQRAVVLCWVAFVAPWIALYVALRRTVREVSRQSSVADVLVG